MQLTAPAKELAKAATAAFAMANERSNIPILGSLLVTADANTAAFAGSSLEGYTKVSVAAEVGAVGSVALDGRIAKLLSSLPGDAQTTIIIDQGVATLKCGRARYRIDMLPAEEFPPAPTAEESTEFRLSDIDRRRLFELPAFAISDEKTRYYLCGLHLKYADGCLAACATNGHQLIRTSIIGSPDWLPEKGVIIPARACAAISKLDGCTVQVNDKCIEAFTDNCHFSHKLIDATYPDYRRVIPAPSGNRVEVDRLELIAALNRMALVAAREKSVTTIAEFDWVNDELSLSLARQSDAAADVLPVITGNGGKTAFALGMFVGLLGALNTERVVLDASDPGSGVRITLPGDDDLIAVQMPCRV